MKYQIVLKLSWNFINLIYLERTFNLTVGLMKFNVYKKDYVCQDLLWSKWNPTLPRGNTHTYVQIRMYQLKKVILNLYERCEEQFFTIKLYINDQY